MVLASLGHEVAEATLRTLCDCTVFETEALKAVDAMLQFGFPGTTKQPCTLEDLRQQLHDGHWPIVFVNTVPIMGQRNAHALVVVEVDPSQLTVYDPLDGERILPQATLLTAWAMMHSLAILIQR
jgi:ABC-type bacteriocin/lantibiotic exporter with double-glycine peptidase domain